MMLEMALLLGTVIIRSCVGCLPTARMELISKRGNARILKGAAPTTPDGRDISLSIMPRSLCLTWSVKIRHSIAETRLCTRLMGCRRDRVAPSMPPPTMRCMSHALFHILSHALQQLPGAITTVRSSIIFTRGRKKRRCTLLGGNVLTSEPPHHHWQASSNLRWWRISALSLSYAIAIAISRQRASPR